MKKEDWVWMPHPGHFICARDCKFFLHTYVGKYVVSTVGELLPDLSTCESYARMEGIKLDGTDVNQRKSDFIDKHGFVTVGHKRTYETMVFLAEEHPGECCPWRASSGNNVDFKGYNDPAEAAKGHMELCLKYADRGTEEDMDD
jgi:hypothetical protein